MKNKNWSFTITGKGDEPNAVQVARDTVSKLRKQDHQISDARFVLIQSGDSKEAEGQTNGKIDLLESFGERSVPSSSAFQLDAGMQRSTSESRA